MIYFSTKDTHLKTFYELAPSWYEGGFIPLKLNIFQAEK